MSKKSIRFVRSLSSNTQKSYESIIREYEKFHGKEIDELVCEALDEQTKQVPPHMLTIIDRIEDYQRWLINKDQCRSTIQLKISKIKTIYKKNRVVLPYLEELNSTDGRKREYIQYQDILTKEEIKRALPLMNPTARARTLVMCQGGLSNEECEHLTTSSFITELKKYHQKDDIIEALEWLADENHPVIWVTKLIRQKTHKPYYALIGAEAVNSIAEAKLYERKLKKFNYEIPEKLLSSNKTSFQNTLKKINDDLGYGRVAEERKLRPHMLRKFHATNINGSSLTYEENSLLSLQEIDEMQGRGKTSVQDTYIKTNPVRQKCLYAKVMNNVCFYHEYSFTLTEDDVLLEVVDMIKEKEKLERKVKNLELDLQNKKKASEKVKKLRKELGDDVFEELINEILTAS